MISTVPETGMVSRIPIASRYLDNNTGDSKDPIEYDDKFKGNPNSEKQKEKEVPDLKRA